MEMVSPFAGFEQPMPTRKDERTFKKVEDVKTCLDLRMNALNAS